MMMLDSSLDLISSLIREWFTLNPAEPFKTAVKVTSIFGTLVTIATTLSTKTVPWFAAKLKSRSVAKRLGPEFTVAGIHRSIRYYVRALCQDLDPAGGEEPRLVFGVQQKLFEALDKVLTHPTEYNFVILLADSGMGKTSALINYYARHLRRFRKPFNLCLIPLGIPDADERIAAIKDRAGTVLFLDALDEDTLAIVDHVERLRTLLQSTRDFERVLISCRTQFFSKDEEIPRETGKIKVSARAAGEAAEYYFHKIYLSPFTDEQVSKYLKRRYPIWRLKRRRKAKEIVRKIPNLTVRPMLLAHVDDIVQADRKIESSYQLYQEMVDAWLTREQGFIKERDNLLQFSERLAVDIYLNRAERGSERIQKDELVALAREWGIALEDWKLSGRSLLNRDAEGNYKFAHRSIMEYLFVQRFLQGELACLEVEWTDQMKDFFLEVLEHDFQQVNSHVLPLLVRQGKAGSATEPSYGRRFFEMILKETQSPNSQRRDQALRAFGRICSEMITRVKVVGVFIELRMLPTASTHVLLRKYTKSRDVYFADGNVISVRTARTGFERSQMLTDRFPPTVIQSAGEMIGFLTVGSTEPAWDSVSEERWAILRDFVSPTDASVFSYFNSNVTSKARQVLELAGRQAFLSQASLIGWHHILLALINHDPQLFARVAGMELREIGALATPYDPTGAVSRALFLNKASAIDLRFSEKAKAVLMYASLEALDANEHIDWSHLLLGLMRAETHSDDSRLKTYGIDYFKVKKSLEAGRDTQRERYPFLKPPHKM